MDRDISDRLRRLVAKRDRGRCEYCLLHEEDSYSPDQIDHIISRKHGGVFIADSLAYACLRCNAWKGSDIGSFDLELDRFVSLFHPRRQIWIQHFRLLGYVIEPLTPEGRVTARLLKFNLDKRVAERRALMQIGRYPL